MFTGEKSPGPAQTCLDLVQDQSHTVLRTQASDPFQITGWWKMNATLSLNGFKEKGSNIVSVATEPILKCFTVTELNKLHTRWSWPKSFRVLPLSCKRQCAHSLAMKRASGRQNDGTACTCAHQLYRSLNGFGSGTSEHATGQVSWGGFRQGMGKSFSVAGPKRLNHGRLATVQRRADCLYDFGRIVP